jgi:hypothetical protein
LEAYNTVLIIGVNGGVGQQRQATCPLNLTGQGPLVKGTITGDAPGNNFTALGDKKTQGLGSFIV